jgi:hypothetical protein
MPMVAVVCTAKQVAGPHAGHALIKCDRTMSILTHAVLGVMILLGAAGLASTVYGMAVLAAAAALCLHAWEP